MLVRWDFDTRSVLRKTHFVVLSLAPNGKLAWVLLALDIGLRLFLSSDQEECFNVVALQPAQLENSFYFW